MNEDQIPEELRGVLNTPELRALFLDTKGYHVSDLQMQGSDRELARSAYRAISVAAKKLGIKNIGSEDQWHSAINQLKQKAIEARANTDLEKAREIEEEIIEIDTFLEIYTSATKSLKKQREQE